MESENLGDLYSSNPEKGVSLHTYGKKTTKQEIAQKGTRWCTAEGCATAKLNFQSSL